jgi:hypothetical protein
VAAAVAREQDDVRVGGQGDDYGLGASGRKVLTGCRDRVESGLVDAD